MIKFIKTIIVFSLVLVFQGCGTNPLQPEIKHNIKEVSVEVVDLTDKNIRVSNIPQIAPLSYFTTPLLWLLGPVGNTTNDYINSILETEIYNNYKDFKTFLLSNNIILEDIVKESYIKVLNETNTFKVIYNKNSRYKFYIEILDYRLGGNEIDDDFVMAVYNRNGNTYYWQNQIGKKQHAIWYDMIWRISLIDTQNSNVIWQIAPWKNRYDFNYANDGILEDSDFIQPKEIKMTFNSMSINISKFIIDTMNGVIVNKDIIKFESINNKLVSDGSKY